MTRQPDPLGPQPARTPTRPIPTPVTAGIRWHRALPPDMITTLAAVDIVAFGDPRRDIKVQLRLRDRLYETLIEAFTITGLPWWDCHCEDRGDGALIVAPPHTNPDHFLDPLAHNLDAILRRDNRLASGTMRIQLRMAVHHGRVYSDAHGVAGHAAIHVFRLLEAPTFKNTLRAADTDLAMIVSDQLYTDVTRRGGLLYPNAYQQLHITNKETRDAPAWLWLPPRPSSAQP